LTNESSRFEITGSPGVAGASKKDWPYSEVTMQNELKRDWGIAVLRVAAGMVFFSNGCQKVFVFGLGYFLPQGFAFTMFAMNVALGLTAPGAAAMDRVIIKGGA